jgi:hypothetical protein
VQVVMVPRQLVRPGRAAHLSYGVCAESSKGDFDNWRLARTLRCEGWDEAVNLPERPLPPLLPGSRCTLLADSLPSRMAPGSCTFALRLSRDGADDETRSLGFRVATPEAASR